MEMEMEMDSLVGFRFKPTDEEIIRLLKERRLNPDFSVQTVKEIDFYRFDPWELPWYSEIQSKESIWYFYCKPYNFKNSNRSKQRKTKSGSWKITGNGSTMKAKHTEVVIGHKKILSFYLRGAISKKAKTEWVMHEIHAEYDPLYKEEVVLCRLKRRRHNKSRISTSDDSESSHLVVAEDPSLKFVPPLQLVYDRNHVAEKTSLLPSHNLQVLPNQYLASDTGNHAGENIFSGFEDQPQSQCLTSDCNNHAAENSLPTVECQQLPSHYFNFTSDYINQYAENIFQMDEFQQLPSHHLTSYFIGQVAEHSFPGGESMLFAQFDALQGSNDLNYNSFPALQSPIDVEADGFSGCNGLDHNSFSAQQSPVNTEQQTSSYFDGFSDCNVLDFQFDDQQVDLICAFQDKCPLAETEQALSPGFNSSDYRNHVAESILPTDESQLLPSHHSVSHSRNYVVQNNYPPVESQLPSHYSMSDFRDQVAEHSFSGGESLLFAQYFDGLNSLPALHSPINVEDDGFSGGNGLDHNSCSAQQSPLNPEWGLSSYSDGFSDCDMLNFQFDDKQENMSSQLTVQDKCPLEETGHTISTWLQLIKISH